MDELVDVFFKPVLDKGFIRLIDHMGDDKRIVEAARVSYQKGTTKVRDDEALLRHLLRNHHVSPFGHCFITAHVKLPLFVAAQWRKHDAMFAYSELGDGDPFATMFEYNELSARYSEMQPEFYEPEALRLGGSSGNKQASGNTLSDDVRLYNEEGSRSIRVGDIRQDMTFEMRGNNELYQLIAERGIERGLARIVLPVAQYTEFWATSSLRGWMNFLALRDADDAQLEIREYARVMSDIFESLFPITHKAYVDYIRNSRTVPGPIWQRIGAHVDWEAVYIDSKIKGRIPSDVREMFLRLIADGILNPEKDAWLRETTLIAS